jgi:pilus assembly protein Flp/PilA
MRAKIKNFIQNETGATSIEYAVIASGIAIAILATVNTLGSTVNGMWTSVATAMR